MSTHLGEYSLKVDSFKSWLLTLKNVPITAFTTFLQLEGTASGHVLPDLKVDLAFVLKGVNAGFKIMDRRSNLPKSDLTAALEILPSQTFWSC